jgi:cytochrome c peroxidase
MRVLAAFALIVCAQAQTQLRSLKGVPVPEPPNLGDYVRDKKALVALGKVFFWDMQVGSDGVTACATCHFHAGADHRPQNMLSDTKAGFPLNAELSSLQFPFRVFADMLNKDSAVLRDSSARVGSMGTVRRKFEAIVPGQAAEIGRDMLDKPEFMQGDRQLRRVTSRNTPSAFNTAYYERGFWDGRATRRFNGFTVTGREEDAPGVLVSVDGALRREPVRMDFSSLASQGVGPALDHLEMSYEGRTWPVLARKMFSLKPLGAQRVAVTDSVLGELAAESKGLVESVTYRSLIEKAFHPRFWESSLKLNAAGEVTEDGESTQAEHNFSLFWGLALQAYQATLNSDDSPFDRFMDGDRDAMSALAQEGLRVFQRGNNCTECHNGAEISAAALNSNGSARGHAFDRTGVRPQAEDEGAGNANFKSISLRNIEFTGPYFHNGGTATLEQTVAFYLRRGDFSPVANDVNRINMTDAEAVAVVEFMKALSDDRVRYEKAPFDHPELCVPVGHEDGPEAKDKMRLVPAVGAAGNSAPLRTFEELLAGVTDKAHSLTEACVAQ